MSVGLDLGTTELRCIRNSGGELIARRCKASYLVLKDSPGHRRLLQHSRARHGTCGEDLIVFGDDAVECGAMLDMPVVPLLRDGRLPQGDPVARQILALMVEAVLPAAEPGNPICCLTLPGGYGLDDDTQSLDVRFLKQLVALRGYSPQLVSSSLAIVLAELSGASFSGLGISLGATNCEFGVIHCGRELARCSIAGRLADLADDIPPREGQATAISGIETAPPAADGETLRAAWERNCARILTDILTEARDTLVIQGAIRLIQQPVNIAVSGGITRSDGFAGLFQRAWNQAVWPTRVAKTIISSDPGLSIARGNVIKAILEAPTAADRRVA